MGIDVNNANTESLKSQIKFMLEKKIKEARDRAVIAYKTDPKRGSQRREPPRIAGKGGFFPFLLKKH
jgi:hypothetical protein